MTEQVEEQAESQTETESKSEAEKEQSKGTEFTEFSTPEEEARFKRVYGHMKQNERKVHELAEMNRNLIEKVEAIEADRSEEKTQDQLSDLKQAERQALEEGDFETAQQKRDQITELQIPKEETKEETQERPAWFTPERETVLVEWAFETDSQGKAVRPWADPKHARHQSAMTHAAALMDEIPAGADEDEAMQQVFDKLDLLMGTEKPKATRKTPGVLSNDGNHRESESKEPQLTRDQKSIATAMYPKLPPEEAYKQYGQALKKYGASNAS